MTIQAHRISDDLQLVRLSLDAIEQATRTPGQVVWVDVESTSRDEILRALDMLQVTGMSRRLVLEQGERPGVVPLKQELLLSLPVLTKGQFVPTADVLTVLCRENVLLTIHEDPLWPEQGRNWVGAPDWLPARSTTALVAAAMIGLSQFTMRRTAELRRAILDIEARMERSPESVRAGDLVALRPDLALLGAVVADQQPALQALTGIDRPYFKLGDAQDYMHCALANVNACERAAAGLEERLVALRAAFQMHAQDKMNRRLNTMTVLSGIFMPITLLAGIWGMNFENMPELHEPLGYRAALMIMAGMAFGLYLLFRNAGWFR